MAGTPPIGIATTRESRQAPKRAQAKQPTSRLSLSDRVAPQAQSEPPLLSAAPKSLERSGPVSELGNVPELGIFPGRPPKDSPQSSSVASDRDQSIG